MVSSSHSAPPVSLLVSIVAVLNSDASLAQNLRAWFEDESVASIVVAFELVMGPHERIGTRPTDLG